MRYELHAGVGRAKKKCLDVARGEQKESTTKIVQS